MSFNIVVDSCCDLTPELRGSGQFRSVPLTIFVGDSEYRDDQALNTELLADAIAMCSEAAHTACPSPADYLEAYEAEGDDVYVVTLSALLSGSCNSAQQAAKLFLEEHPERHVHVFNSCSASSGETLIAKKIAELAGQGLPFEQVVRDVEHFIAEMNTLFVLDDLDTLRKNGRLSRVQSLVTGALRIKLVMGATSEGEICKHTQALSVKQALSKLAEIMAKDDRHRGKTLCISHCLCLDRAEYLKTLALKTCDFARIIITDTRGISTVYANTGGVIAAY